MIFTEAAVKAFTATGTLVSNDSVESSCANAAAGFV
jgi:hypothetical protein